MSPKEIRRAAQLLREEADQITDSETDRSGPHKGQIRFALARRDELLELSRKLRALALSKKVTS